MKNLIISLIALTMTFQLIAQPVGILEFNNVKARIQGDGALFNDPVNLEPAFEVPKGTGADVIYFASLWLTGVNSGSSQVMSSSAQYSQAGIYRVGPIADSYDSSYYSKYDRVWFMTKLEAEGHRDQWNKKDYIMPEGIKSWPGNGNVANGEADQLAPYTDRNQNGIYEPELGDFPCIEGDEAIYIIYNDLANRDVVQYGEGMGVEVHLMAYEYSETNQVNNTVFLEYKVHNRSSNTYTDFKLGMFTDIDLGCSLDDYIGCDTSANTFFGYNGDTFDEDCNGQIGYKGNTPAVGFTFLNRDLDGFISFVNGSGPMGDPNSAQEYHDYMNMKWRDGSPLTFGDGGYGGITPTKYMYPGDPNDTNQWSEGFYVPADRKVLGVTTSSVFKPTSIQSLDIAVNFTLGIGAGLQYPSVAELTNSMDVVENHYLNTTNDCDLFVGNPEQKLMKSLRLYPNPASNYLNLDLSEGVKPDVRIFNSIGAEVFKAKSIEGRIDVSSLPEGVYLVHVLAEGTTEVQRIVISR